MSSQELPVHDEFTNLAKKEIYGIIQSAVDSLGLSEFRLQSLENQVVAPEPPRINFHGFISEIGIGNVEAGPIGDVLFEDLSSRIMQVLDNKDIDEIFQLQERLTLMTPEAIVEMLNRHKRV